MEAKKYLQENPKCDVIHSTSDGSLFYNKCDATSHAKTLEDKNVETFNQEKKMVATSSKDDSKLLAATGEAPKVEVPKVEVPKVEKPKVEKPKVEKPKVKKPAVEKPKVEAPKVEAPKVETPKVEAQG